MKIILIVVLVISSIVAISAQNACCAPINWRGSYRSYVPDGKSFESFFIHSQTEDAAYLNIFYQSEADVGQVLTEIWWYTGQKVAYRYVSTTDTCTKQTDDIDLTDLNNCVGQKGSKFVTSVTIASTLCDVWAAANNNSNTIYFDTVTRNGCLPVAISVDSENNPGYSFRDLFLWTNVTTDNVVIPKLNTACSSAKLSSVPIQSPKEILRNPSKNL